ncbi:hypothetical protein [Paenibacillus oenotherae]|uniref:hypothetical protein n=1 Tax=Paenibacillus oenotherae TaxID=1435645 RepID=UPI001FE57176|nr:hypothetical protein [Paenibacillus oenotherae]
MVQESVYLAVWLLGLFGLVGIVSICVARLIIHDSRAYDEHFVWKRKLPPE